ncbi:hypothetical protein [Denitromonas sp.]|uniref:hypothetical protein n=1 Tax=Denitromonas sp. TaxID=2734609 RepID=UPI003A8C79D8
MNEEQALSEALLTEAKTGSLLRGIRAQVHSDRLAAVLASLHNNNQVDVVAAFRELTQSEAAGPSFFVTRHVFEELLPDLNASVGAVVRCVLHLSREAGEGILAGSILSSYVDFCLKDPERPREALQLVEGDLPALMDIMPATIVAGSQLDGPFYLAETIRFLTHADVDVRRRAVFSLARFQWTKGEGVPDSAIVALDHTVERESDDNLLASAIGAAFSVLSHDSARTDWSIAFIDKALTKGADQAIHAASKLLIANTKNLPPSLCQLLLRQLKRVEPTNKDTLDYIDLGIGNLLARDDPEEGLRFLEDLIVGGIPTNVFDNTLHRIRENPSLTSKVVTRWFLRSQQTLWIAVEEIGQQHSRQQREIAVDPVELKPGDGLHIVFVARKAIGYFMTQPITAASLIISLMAHAPDDETLNALGQLLFDPLMMNYPGSAREYVEKRATGESGKVKDTIGKALASIDQYLDVLCAMPDLATLQPSQSQREAYHRHSSESMAASMRAAQEQSVFFNLVSHSTLLYGNRSINYVHTAPGETRRTEMQLARHGVEFEFPRMDSIDPYELNYMYRVFRLESLRA